MPNTFLQIRKASTFLSRDVSCRFEPTIVDIFCVVIELISLGVGFSRGFLEDITVRNQKRRLNNRMIEIKNQYRAQTNNYTDANRPQEIMLSREQIEKEFQHYSNTIEDLCRNDPNQFLC